MTDDELAETLEQAKAAQSGSTIGNLKASVQGWRNTLDLDNGLVQMINVVCVGAGAGIWIETAPPGAYVGVILVAMGAVGFLDAIVGRLVA